MRANLARAGEQFKSYVTASTVWERRLVATGILFGAILLVLPLNFDVSQADRVLATLATAQASILAIVFSVSILGIQLVANRYSARMTTVITSSVSFQRTLLFLGFSIGIDLLLLLQLPVLAANVTIAGVAIAGGFAAASGVVLINYVQTTLERSTPEGLLSAYTDQMTPEGYHEDVEASRENADDLHPMHELHMFVMSGLSNGEWATAENGLLSFERVSKRMLEAFAAENRLDRRDSLTRYYFKTPIEEYLPRITAEALEDGEDDLARQGVDTLGEIGEASLEQYFPSILGPVASGLTQIVQDAPEGRDGDTIRGDCLAVYSNLLVKVADQPSPRDVPSFLSAYASRLRVLLIRDREPWIYEHNLSEFFRQGVASAHETTVTQYHDYIAELDAEWQSRSRSTEVAGDGPYKLLLSYRRYSLDVTGYVLQYHQRNDEWPMNMSALRTAWATMTKDAVDAQTGAYGRAVCRWYIDLAYLVSQIEGGNEGRWARELARIQNENDSSSLVDDAFEAALQEGITPPFEKYQRQISPASKKKSFFDKIMDLTPPDMTAYEKWTQEFHKEVARRRQRLG